MGSIQDERVDREAALERQEAEEEAAKEIAERKRLADLLLVASVATLGQRGASLNITVQELSDERVDELVSMARGLGLSVTERPPENDLVRWASVGDSSRRYGNLTLFRPDSPAPVEGP